MWALDLGKLQGCHHRVTIHQPRFAMEWDISTVPFKCGHIPSRGQPPQCWSPHQAPNAENAVPLSHGLKHLVEKANNLSCGVLPSGLLMVHNTSRGGQDHIAKLTSREQLDNPLLHVGQPNIVAGGDDTRLVEAALVVSVPSFSRRASPTYRPFSWTTILPLRWSSTSSNSPM